MLNEISFFKYNNVLYDIADEKQDKTLLYALITATMIQMPRKLFLGTTLI